MTTQDMIEKLVVTRDNTLSVKSIEVVKTPGSMGNPCLRVGTLPFYDWDKVKQITFVITYGRYLNCEMLVYDKQIKADKDYIIVKGIDAAATTIRDIINKATTPLNHHQ